MAKQTINQGTAPTGASGDTFRTGSAKLQANDDEIYNYLGDGVNLNKLGTAAFKNTGIQAGNVMEVGAFGIGAVRDLRSENLDNKKFGQGLQTGMISWNQLPLTYPFGTLIHISNWNDDTANGCVPTQIVFSNQNAMFRYFNSVWSPLIRFLTSSNTTTDSNGFIKAASPVIKLLASKIEPNEEALEQEPVFEKVNIGHYLLKNTEGFSVDGWYIEMPKDANGNVLVAVQYQQLKDNTIEVKTFAKKFDEETGDIIPNLEKPRDIPSGRWIDIRLKALPQLEIEISKTPVDFQPTGIAQAISEMINGTEQ